MVRVVKIWDGTNADKEVKRLIIKSKYKEVLDKDEIVRKKMNLKEY